MTILPLDPTANPSPDALRAFLAQCQAVAKTSGRDTLASISLAVGALDPLAVLESIFEPDEPHFYAERTDLESAVAGAETAASFTASGPGRFSAVQRWVDEILAHTIAVGAIDAPFGGPHFFTSFSFRDDVEPGEAFPAAHVFIPRWQVARAGQVTTAVANLLVAADADLNGLVERVWRAHAKFHNFKYHSTELAEPNGGGVSSPRTDVANGTTSMRGEGTPPPSPFQIREAGDYRATVAGALERIAAGEFEKIVLARARDLSAGQPLHPLRILNGLRQRFPDCYAFSLANGAGQSFIGASPERLVRISKGVLETEALAGSIRRGRGASEDAALAIELLHGEKDLREHRLVVETITGRLAQLGLAPEFSHAPGLRRLANVQHLHTPIRASLPANVRLLDALAALHPTPAVGGIPMTALARIRELEGFPRGLYAGALGWMNARGGGEFFVGLRSAVIDGPTARVYAGAGIVAGSTPEKEFAETELKFRAMLDALLA